MSQGRAQGVALAMGVFTGSAFWGLTAAFGLGALMLANAWAVEVMRYVAASYLIWLGYKSLKLALNYKPTEATISAQTSLKASYLRGLFIHLTNPKAIFAWGAVFSIAVPPAAELSELLRVGLSLGLCSFLMFPAYAWVFSTKRAMRIYHRFGRWVSGTFGILFGAVGISILAVRL